LKLILAFVLAAFGMILPNAYASSASIEVNGNNYDVQYEATGLTVDGLEADTVTATLTVLITTSEIEGTLQITLDRNFFDSNTDGVDDDFIVLLDGGQDTIPVEEKTDSARTLTITVPAETNSIDIIGTSFGTGEPTPVEEEPAPIEEEPAPTEIPEESTSTPVEEEPTPIEEEPAPTEIPEEPTSAPTEESTMKECGPGTILKDNECVLDETCGPGTVLKDDQCVLDSTSAPTVSKSEGSQFVAAIIAGFIIAMIVMIILWAIGRAGRHKN
jgi:hypothetical protein